jgi:hypothetical protein
LWGALRAVGAFPRVPTGALACEAGAPAHDSPLSLLQDTNGDENDHLFIVRIGDTLKSGGATRAPAPVDLTPLGGVKASGLMTSKAVRFLGRC